MITILLADDHQIVRDGLRRYLDGDDDLHVIAEAASGPDAVQLAAEKHPDIVVMDISMPGLNGIEAARRIRRDTPSVRIIGLSQYTETRFVAEMMSAGAAGYLPKKCAARELVQAIRAVIAGRTYLSPEIAGGVMDEFLSGRDPEQASVFARLSEREREILQLIAEGRSAKDIAARLHLSHRTVNTHRENIMQKLGMDNLADLVKYAVREGLTEL